MFNHKLLSCLLTGVILLFSGGIKAQDSLSLAEAIEITLKNNYGLKMAENNQKVAENNVTLGNAGFLPRLDLRASQQYSINNTRLNFISGETIDRQGAKSDNTNAGLYLEWVLFDGLARFTDYTILKEQGTLSKLKRENLVEETIAKVTDVYYELVKNQQKLELFNKVMEYSRFRLQIANEKYRLGSASKTEYLNAKVDFNSDSSRFLQLKKELFKSSLSLKDLMSQQGNGQYITDSLIPVARELKVEELKKDLTSQNIELEMARKQKELAVLEFNKIKKEHYPQLTFNTSYTFLQSYSEAGFVSTNRNLGFTYGFGLNYKLFNGFEVWRKKQNAHIQIESEDFRLKEREISLDNELLRNYELYKFDQSILELEEENVSVAQKNMDLAIDNYKLGGISAFELREIQKNYIDSYIRYIEAQYQLKTDETKLLLISGRILN